MATLTVKNVKGLKDGSYEFRDIAYIVGGNRSGKSAILQSIQYVVFGKCDEIGSRGAGALVRNGQPRCEIQYSDGERDFSAVISVSSKGAVSQTRTCKIKGMEVASSEIDKLAGGVPVTIQQFMDLTGEQMWKLATPQAGVESAIPDGIIDQVNQLIEKLGKCGEPTGPLKASLTQLEDLSQMAGAILDAVKESQRTTHERCRAIMSLLESPTKVYSGPPLADLILEETSLKERIKQISAAIAQRNKDNGTIEYNKQQIELQQAKLKSMESEHSVLEERIQKLKECEVAVEGFVMPDFLDADKIPTNDLFSQRVARLIDSIQVLNPEHPICNKAREFSGLLSDYVTDRTYVRGRDPEFDQRYDNLVGLFMATKVSSVIRPSLIGKEEALRSVRFALEVAEIGVKSISDRGAAIKDSIEKLSKETGFCMSNLSSIDIDRFQADSARLTEVTSVIKEARESQALLAQSQDARARCDGLKRVDAIYDQLIRDVQEYRKGILDDNLALIAQKANKIIEYCSLPPIEIEAVAGKRPSLLVRNVSGSQFAAMSGAERLIYGAGLISAIQAVRNVAMPLLFLEAEPAEGLYTNKLLLALCQYCESRVFVAHWFEASAASTRLGVVNVA